MESGVLYLAMSIAHFVSYFGHDDFTVHMNGTLVSPHDVVSELTISMTNLLFRQHTIVIGIAYDLIIIRVGQNRTEDEHNLTNGKLTTFQAADLNHGASNQSTGSIVTANTTEIRRDKLVAV